MQYAEFKQSVLEKVRESVGKDAQVEVQTFLKNNARRQDGLLIFRKDRATTPAIYLEHYYEQFQQGTSIGAIVREITSFYDENGDMDFDLSFFQDYEQVKERIVFYVVNYERNLELLKSVPYVRSLDMAFLFSCRLEHPVYGSASILIHNEHMEKWGVTVVALYEEAMKNTPRLLPCELKSMGELLGEIGQEIDLNIPREIVESEQRDPGMFVLSNYLHYQGAACMWYRGILAKFAMACGSDFYIIPSSIHEVILIPVKKMHSHSDMCEIVRTVNRTQVEPEEILADTVYFYSKKLKKILF